MEVRDADGGWCDGNIDADVFNGFPIKVHVGFSVLHLLHFGNESVMLTALAITELLHLLHLLHFVYI